LLHNHVERQKNRVLDVLGLAENCWASDFIVRDLPLRANIENELEIVAVLF
jgi:hypothetical protein